MNTHTGKDGEFFQKVKDRVYDGEFKELNGFEYSCFKFKFKLESQQYQKEFSNLLQYNNPLMPWDVCNFFQQRGINFKINYRYCKGIGLKYNLTFLKTVLFLKKEMIRVSFLNFLYKLKNKTI